MSGWPASKSLSFEDFAGHQLELIIVIIFGHGHLGIL